MSKNIYGLSDLTNEAVMDVVRRKFLFDAETNPHLYHPKDIERCRSEDWQIERFIIEKGSPEEALKALMTAMQWKKSFGVHDRDHTYFPREFFRIFGYQKPSVDREGHLCIWENDKHYRKISDLEMLIKQFIVFYTERIDRMAGNEGFVSVSDCKDVEMRHADMSLAKFTVELIAYYPCMLKRSLNVDLPWYLNALWKVVLGLMPKSSREKTLLISRKELLEYVDIEEIPVSLGGKRETTYDQIEQEMLPLRDLKHLNLTDKQIDNFYKVYNLDKIYEN